MGKNKLERERLKQQQLANAVRAAKRAEAAGPSRTSAAAQQEPQPVQQIKKSAHNNANLLKKPKLKAEKTNQQPAAAGSETEIHWQRPILRQLNQAAADAGLTSAVELELTSSESECSWSDSDFELVAEADTNTPLHEEQETDGFVLV